MSDPIIYITAADQDKLSKLIWNARSGEYRNSPYLRMLSGELTRARIVTSAEIPPDVITMNSRVLLLDVDTGEEMAYTLVFPEDADAIEGKISVLAPIGTAMLGYRAGDMFQWDTPDGKRSLKVEKVIYQPEAAGDEGS